MKTKFRLWLNIVTICLCVCAIAVGVYAATNASLTVSGQIGFKAHDCLVEITGTKQGYDTSTGSEYTYQKEATAMTFDSAESITIGGKTNADINKTANIGTLMFNDLTENYVPDIVLSFTAKNLSYFAISFKVEFGNLEGIEVSSSSEEEFITNRNETATITLTYKLLSIEENVSLSNLNIKIICSKKADTNGKPAIVANNCKVELSGTKQGYDTSTGSTHAYQKEPIALTFDGNESMVLGGTQSEVSQSADIGSFTFNNKSEDYVPDIVLSFTVKNLSDNPITFAIVHDDLDEVVVTTTSLEAKYIESKDETATITLTCKLLSDKANVDLSDLNIQILCSKFSTETEYIDKANNMHFYKNAEGTAWTVGPNTETATGKVVVPQYVQNLPVIGLFEDNGISDCSAFEVYTKNATPENAAIFNSILENGVQGIKLSEEVAYIFCKIMGAASGVDVSEFTIIPEENAMVYTIISIKDENFKAIYKQIKSEMAKDVELTDTQMLLFIHDIGFGSLTFDEMMAMVGTKGENYTAVPYVASETGVKKYSYLGTQITEIELPNTTKEMPYDIINCCSQLTTINIPSSISEIPERAFQRAASLQNVTIGNGVTSIGYYAFECSTDVYNLKTVRITNLCAWCNIEFGNYYSNPLTYAKDLYINEQKVTNLTIPSTIKEIKDFAFSNCTNLATITLHNNLTSIGARAFYGCAGLPGALIIPNKVTSIGYEAFSNCKNLTSVTIGENVETIGYAAFDGCAGLTGALIIPNKVTSIGGSAFGSCKNLTRVTIGENVETIGDNAFYDCAGLTGALIIPNKVTSIGRGAFHYCKNLTSVTIGENVKTIDYNAFDGCAGLTGALIIPNKVTIIRSSAFNKCSNLTSVTIGENVETIGDTAFSNCAGLTGALIIPNKVTSIGGSAFRGCSNLTSVTIGETVETIGGSAFYGCAGLTDSLIIPNKVTSIGDYAFNECINLTSVTIGETVETIGKYAFNGCAGLIDSLIIPNKVTSIGDHAFNGCSNLTSVTIGEKVETIGDYAFQYCFKLVQVIDNSKLLSFTIGNSSHGYIASYAREVITPGQTPSEIVTDSDGFVIFNNTVLVGYRGTNTEIIIPQAITDINKFAFYKDKNINSVTIGDNVEIIGDYAFYECSNLTSVTIGEKVETIGDYAFQYCYKLVQVIDNSTLLSFTIGNNSHGYISLYATEIITPEQTPSEIVTDSDGFVIFNNTVLIGYRGTQTEIEIPNGIIGVNDYCFYENEKITSVVFPESVTWIGQYAFGKCFNLTKVTIGEKLQRIYWGAFDKCSNLHTVYITNMEAWCKMELESSYSNPLWNDADLYLNNQKVTNLIIPETITVINAGVFYGCRSLTSVTIGENIIRIGDSAFNACSELKTVYITNMEAWCKISFGLWSNPLDNGADLYLNNQKVTNLIIPETITQIKDYTFCGCKSLTSVTIHDNVTSIGEEAFYNCSNLTSVTIGAKVSSIGEGAFGKCSNLTSVTIGAKVSSIDSSAFSGCSEIKTVYITNMEAWCKISFDGWNSNPLHNGADLYLNNQKVTNLTIPETITQIKDYTFYGCTSLISVVIHDKVTSIGESAFSHCTNLTSVTIGKGVKSIGFYAFYDCINLTSITIPDNVTGIGYSAFENCGNLVRVTFDGVTPPAFGSNVFKRADSNYSNLIIDVPDSAIDAYKAVLTPSAVVGNVQ